MKRIGQPVSQAKNRDRRWRTSTAAAVLFGLLSLSSCAVRSDLVLESTGTATIADKAFAYTPAESADDGAIGSKFSRKIVAALEDKSFAQRADAPVILEVGISVRDADTGITDAKGAAVSGQVDWQSDPRKKRLLDGCRVSRVRGTMLMVDLASGGVLYRGSGDFDTCDVADGQIDDLARALVADAIGS